MSQGYYNSENDDSRPTSPYPPSSSCASEEEDHSTGAHGRRQGRPTLSVRVHSPSSDFALFLDGIPDHTLREVVLRMSNNNSRFQCVLQKELANALSTTSASATKSTKNPTKFALQTPPTTPTTPRTALGASGPAASVYDKALDTPKARSTNAHLKPHSRSRGRRHTHPPRSHFSASSEEHRQIRPHGSQSQYHSDNRKTRSVAEIVYHPGQIGSHAYEFVARTPAGETSKSVRTIAMWSCCDEDEKSPGCVRTVTRSPPASRVPKTMLPSPVGPATPHLVYPQQFLGTALFEEEASDDTDFASFAVAKFSSIEAAHELEGELRDVYPDSDLEAFDSVSLHTSSSILTSRFS